MNSSKRAENVAIQNVNIAAKTVMPTTTAGNSVQNKDIGHPKAGSRHANLNDHAPTQPAAVPDVERDFPCRGRPPLNTVI